MTTEELMDEVLIKELTEVKNLNEGNEKDDKVKNIVALYNAKTANEKVKLESADKFEERLQNDEHHKTDTKLEERKLNKELIIGLAGLGVGVCTMMFNAGMYSHWLRMGFDFEKDNVITEPFIKNLMSKMTPKK